MKRIACRKSVLEFIAVSFIIGTISHVSPFLCAQPSYKATPQNFLVHSISSLTDLKTKVDIPIYTQPAAGLKEYADSLATMDFSGPFGRFWKFDFGDSQAVAGLQCEARKMFLDNLFAVKQEIWSAAQPYLWQAGCALLVLYAIHQCINYQVRKLAYKNAKREYAIEKAKREKA